MILRKQQGIMLILPAILVMGLFTVYPLFEGLRIAFTNANLLKEGVRYIGFQNFIRLLSDERLISSQQVRDQLSLFYELLSYCYLFFPWLI